MLFHLSKPLVAVIQWAIVVGVIGLANANGQELTTAEEVIRKNVDAMGGVERLESIRTMVWKSSVLGAGGESVGEIACFMGWGKFFRTEEWGRVGEFSLGSDGEVVWMISSSGPRLLEEEERARRLSASTCPLRYFAWIDNFDGELEFKGLAKVDEQDAYHLLFKQATGYEISRYFDKASGLLIRESEMRVSPRGEAEVTQTHSDFRVVDGLRWPHKTTVTINGQPRYEEAMTEVKINEKISEEVFALPDDIRALINDD